MTKSSSRMCIDRDLRDLSGRELVSAGPRSDGKWGRCDAAGGGRRRQIPVDVNFGPPDGKFVPLGVTEAADRKPFFAVGDARRAASLASTTIIFDCVYCKADAGREGDKVVDRNHLA